MFVTRESRAKSATRLALCLGFLAISIWMWLSPGTQSMPDDNTSRAEAIGWIGTAFWGIIALRFGWSLVRPGTLTITSTGVTEDLGWRSRHWPWSEIERVELRRTYGGLTSFCMLYPVDSGPVRLFGWCVSPDELSKTIERERAAHSNSTMT
jgi:hypothetical protein